MAAAPPPHGIGEHDYESIEAAVTETVRGRWFLNEFARRNRAAELRQVLDAMGRLESAMAANGAAALPPADPSIRLMMQRIKEISGQLDALARDMREAGVAENYPAALEHQARAVSGLIRGSVPRPLPAHPSDAKLPPPRPALPACVEPPPPRDRTVPAGRSRVAADDPRLAALLELDRLSLPEKLAFFG